MANYLYQSLYGARPETVLRPFPDEAKALHYRNSARAGRDEPGDAERAAEVRGTGRRSSFSLSRCGIRGPRRLQPDQPVRHGPRTAVTA